MRKLIVSLMLSAFVLPASATIINIPNDLPTIQAGIDSSAHGDTVLVHPGTYYESINFNEMNIVLGSLFITTGDTSYISQTVIDGDSLGTVVTIEGGQDTTTFFGGFSVESGFSQEFAGGLNCINNSAPVISHCRFQGNSGHTGGGIFIQNSNAQLSSCVISSNIGIEGGGLHIQDSNLTIDNSIISDNNANYGGGVYSCSQSNVSINLTSVQDNYVSPNGYGGGLFFDEGTSLQLEESQVIANETSIEGRGGGIYLAENSTAEISNSLIYRNRTPGRGGGIYMEDASLLASYTRIVENHADHGGGIMNLVGSTIALPNSTIARNDATLGGGIFSYWDLEIVSEDDRYSIYNNSTINRGNGSDLHFASPSVITSIIVDTFTVQVPTDYHAQPIDFFNFDVEHAMHPQVAADLFVSPQGDNTNTGLTEEDPLQTIQHALSIIFANADNPRAIHLADGVYSPSTNSEYFPINLISYVSLLGASQTGVVLDADSVANVMMVRECNNVVIRKMTLTGGNATDDHHSLESAGGGLCIVDSNVLVDSIVVHSCTAQKGGGIYTKSDDVVISNTMVYGNAATFRGGGIAIRSDDIPSTIQSCRIYQNSAYEGGGISIYGNPILRALTVSNNSAVFGGGIRLFSSEASFDTSDLCNVYSNQCPTRGTGAEIFTYTSYFPTVALDTFTVLNPTGYHIWPLENFDIDIQNSAHQLVSADIYVSPEGDNSNTGLTQDDPVQTIQHAFSICQMDEDNPRTIFLLPGVYSPESNGEPFPICPPDFVTLEGFTWNPAVLDANQNECALVVAYNNNIYLKNLVITGSSRSAIRSWDSDVVMCNVSLVENAEYGIECWTDYSRFRIINSIFRNPGLEIAHPSFQDEIIVHVHFSNIDGGESGFWECDLHWMDGNIDEHPLFQAPAYNNFRLLEGSPCIDAGTDLVISGNDTLLYIPPTEYHGANPDIGASEFDPTGIDNLQIAYTSLNELQLFWSPVPETVCYHIYQSENPYGSWTRVATVVQPYYSMPCNDERGFFRVTWETAPEPLLEAVPEVDRYDHGTSPAK